MCCWCCCPIAALFEGMAQMCTSSLRNGFQTWYTFFWLWGSIALYAHGTHTNLHDGVIKPTEERRLWKTFPLYDGCNMPRASFCHNKLDLWITFNFAKFQFISVSTLLHPTEVSLMILAVHCYVLPAILFRLKVLKKTPTTGIMFRRQCFVHSIYCHNPLSMFTMGPHFFSAKSWSFTLSRGCFALFLYLSGCSKHSFCLR